MTYVLSRGSNWAGAAACSALISLIGFYEATHGAGWQSFAIGGAAALTYAFSHAMYLGAHSEEDQRVENYQGRGELKANT